MRRPSEVSTLQCVNVILAGIMIAVGAAALAVSVVSIATRNDVVPVDTNVFARYCDSPCTAGQIPYFIVADCLGCVSFNTSSGTVSMPTTNLTCIGTGLCPVDDSYGPDLTTLSFTDSGYTTVSRVGNDVNFDTSLPATFVQTCGVPAPCGVNERLSYNGSCASCVSTPSGGLPLCGACAVGQHVTLGVNATCLDCVTPTSGGMILPSSTGNGTSIIANSTSNTFKSIAGSGSTTIVDAADKITVSTLTLVSTAGNITTMGNLITDTSFEVISTATTVELRPRTFQFAGFVATPSVINCVVTIGGIGWWHEQIVSDDTLVFIGGQAVNIVRTHNWIAFEIFVFGGYFEFLIDDAGGSDHLGPGGVLYVSGGGGTFSCSPSGASEPRGGFIWQQGSDSNIFSGAIGLGGLFTCQARWTHESFV